MLLLANQKQLATLSDNMKSQKQTFRHLRRLLLEPQLSKEVETPQVSCFQDRERPKECSTPLARFEIGRWWDQ